MKATWKGQVLAESDDIVTVEGNAYFPADSIRQEFFRPSNTHSNCPWKGEASYYSIEVEGETNGDAAWFYPKAKDPAKPIEGRIAFWRGVEISE